MRAAGWTSALVAAIISAAPSSSSLAFWRGVGLSAAASVTASRARAKDFMRWAPDLILDSESLNKLRSLTVAALIGAWRFGSEPRPSGSVAWAAQCQFFTLTHA